MAPVALPKITEAILVKGGTDSVTYDPWFFLGAYRSDVGCKPINNIINTVNIQSIDWFNNCKLVVA